MWQKLENWRKKDEGTRRLAALCVSAVVTIVIAGVWATVFFRGTAREIVSADIGVDKIVSGIDKSPVAAFSESTTRVWTSIMEQFGELKSAVESLEKVSAPPENATSTATSTEENML
ncbi:MAG: hypothetical protein AAB726_02060 [Patescibacteria group bacterium]